MLVKIYTDGAARGNPDGPGGYGCVLHYTDRNGNLHEKELSAGYKKTTNNRMELMAARSSYTPIPSIWLMLLTSTGSTAGSKKAGNAEKMNR